MKKIELIKSTNKLIFTQKYKNISLSHKVKENFIKLLEYNKELNNCKCKVDKVFDDKNIIITNTYYPEFNTTEKQIKKYKKFNNVYNWFCDFIILFTPIPLSILIGSLYDNVLYYIGSLIILYIIALETYKIVSNKFIDKSFTDIYHYKYKLNITKKEYELIVNNLFTNEQIAAFHKYNKRIGLITTSLHIDLYCIYKTDKEEIIDTDYYENIDKDVILEFTIYGNKNLKHKERFINKIKTLLNIYNNEINQIKCNK